MAKTRLTVAGINKYRPIAGRTREIPDLLSEGLSLSIMPSGTRTWTMRFRRPSGKSAQLTLGRYNEHQPPLDENELGIESIGTPLNLVGARLVAAWVNTQRRRGKDIVAEYQAQKRRAQLQVRDDAANTFAPAARQFIDEVAKVKHRRWLDTAVTLGWDYSNPEEPVMRPGGLSERWKDTPLREIDDAMVFEIIRESGRVGIPGTKPRVKGRSTSRERAMNFALSGMFRWLKADRRIKVNPCIGAFELEPFKVRNRVLDKDEIRWFWAACTAEAWPFGTVLKLLLLSAQRLNEVCQMRKSELRDGVLYLSGDRTKNKKAHVVPLPEQALALIPASDDWMFSTTRHSAISGWSTAKDRIDAAMLKLARAEKGADFTIPPWVIHDLRRTAATGMGELGVMPHVIEAILNHSLKGVAATYNLAQMLADRREGLQRWANHLDGLVHGRAANIIPIRRAES